MFRALLAHHQETLHKCSFGDYCVLKSTISSCQDSGLPRGGGVEGFKPHPKFRSFEKAEPNSLFCGKYIRNNLIRIRVSIICKLSGNPD
jgi:hypothetical protein